MRNMDWDRAFKQTPEVFTQRVQRTLLTLKEEPMKRFTLRTAVLAAAILLALAGVAYAAIQLGQGWYYNNRFTAYKEHEPEKHQAIMDNLQTGITQQISGPAADLVTIKVQDVAWAEEKDVMTLSMLATPKDDKAHELHSAWSMDVDGANVGEIDPDDEESRLHHWLWTDKGYGLPEEVMMDPSKQLLLVTVDYPMYIGDSQAEMPSSSSDIFTTPDGPVMMVYEFDLSMLQPETIDAIYAKVKVPEGQDETEYLKMIEEVKARLKGAGTAAAEAILTHTDEEGYLPLRFTFKVQTFQNDTYGEPVPGEVNFRIKVTGK